MNDCIKSCTVQSDCLGYVTNDHTDSSQSKCYLVNDLSYAEDGSATVNKVYTYNNINIKNVIINIYVFT